MSKKSSGKKPLLGNAPDSAKKEEKNEETPERSNNKDNKREDNKKEGGRSGRGGNRDSRSTSKPRRNRSRSPLPRKWNDKDICRDFLRNRCNRRDCKYYHPPDREPQRMSWFTLCLDYQKGNCAYDDCRFFHLSTEDEDLFIETGEVSLHIIEQAMCNAQLELPTEKDQPTCKDYLKGRCRKNNCRYRHITNAEYESELYQCIQDALQEILGPPRGAMGNFPNQQMPLLGEKGSLLGPVPSSFNANMPVNNMNDSAGALLNQLRPDIIHPGEKPPLMPLPPSLLPMHDDGLNDVESLRRVCRQLQNQLDEMHREREEEDLRRDRNIVGNMLQNSRGGGGSSDDQCLMSQLNSELKEEVEKLRFRNDELVNQIYSVDWERLCSEAKMQVQNLEDENHNLNDELRKREKQISGLKKEAHLWKNYEILVKDQLSKLQKQFFVAEREFCVSWGGGPPPLESQKEAWNAIKTTVSVIARANIQNPSSLKPPPNTEPNSKKGPSKSENVSKDRRRSESPALGKSQPFLDPLKPPFQENFFQPKPSSGRLDSPRHRSGSSNNSSRSNHPDMKSNQESMRKNPPHFRPSSPNNIRIGASSNTRSNFSPGRNHDEPTSFWKSSTGSFAEASTGSLRQNNPNNPPHSNQRPSRSDFRNKALDDERPNSANLQNNSRPNHPGTMNQIKNQAEDSYSGGNYYPNDNLIRYPIPAKEQYNTGIPGAYMNETSQKNAENAEYKANSSGYYSSNTNSSGNYSADSAGYYSANAANTDNYPADSSTYYSNAPQSNAAPAAGSYPTDTANQSSSDTQGNFSTAGNYPEFSANSGQYSSGSYGYDENYGSYVDNSSKNAEIISQMYRQPPPPPPSQGSPNKTWSSDSWKSGYYG
ncbi:UNVERIFIED_CONTAM: hypothetical protein RMT77_000225 [Armadillidium vulgare]